MPDRVVALQLLSSCWLAVILPPLPAVLCFSAIYSNEHFPLSPPHMYQQGRKFGGYRIIPKACKVSSGGSSSGVAAVNNNNNNNNNNNSNNQKETTGGSNTGVCMFNYECAAKDGTVIGACVDGFLYGACCRLPAGVSASTLIDYPPQDDPYPSHQPTKTTPAHNKRPSTSAIAISNTITTTTTVNDWSSLSSSVNTVAKPPQLHHPPAETYLVFENGTAVHNAFNPEEFLHLIKPPQYVNNNNNYYHHQENDTYSIQQIPSSNINPNNNNNNIFDIVSSLRTTTTKASPSTLSDVSITNPKDRSSTAFSARPSYVAGGGNSNTEKFDYNHTAAATGGHTTAKSTQSLVGIMNKNTYSSSSSSSDNSKLSYASISTPSGYTNNKYNSVNYNNNNNNNYNSLTGGDGDENLIRVPTLSATNHKHGTSVGPSNESINHILWLLNQTKLTSDSDFESSSSSTTTATRPPPTTQQSLLYTWLSVQDGGPDKTSSVTKPLITNNYQQQQQEKYSTLLPSTTIHHIPGPSFHVTPEVKITPKPSTNIAESPVPTVIVLTPAHEAVSVTAAAAAGGVTQKKPPPPIFSATTSAAPYNVSYHYHSQAKPSSSSSSKKPFPKPAVSSSSSSFSQETDKPVTSSSSSSLSQYNTVRPVTAGYISKPIYQEVAEVAVTPADISVYTSSVPLKQPLTSSNGGHHHVTTITSGSAAASNNVPPSLVQTTVVTTTAKPITSGISSGYHHYHHHQQQHPTTTTTTTTVDANSSPSSSSFYGVHNSRPPLSTGGAASYISIKPSASVYNKFGGNGGTTTATAMTTITNSKPPYHHHHDIATIGGAAAVDEYPNYLGPYNSGFNSTEDFIAFPPVRNPNANLTATQHEKPSLTATTTFGDEEIIESAEITPQFVVDKTLEDKVHVFVEKIVQSLQGNFEDLEKVLISGESTNNVTITNGGGGSSSLPPKKPNKRPPTTTSSPSSFGKPTKKPVEKPSAAAIRPLKTTTVASLSPTTTTTTITYSTTTTIASSLITKKPSLLAPPPSKKPSLASPVLLFQPSGGSGSTTTTTISKIKVPSSAVSTTTVHIPTDGSSGQYITTSVVESAAAAAALATEEDKVTTVKSTFGQDLKKECGIRPLAKKNGRIVGGKGASFGEWPWQVLVREATWLGLFTKNKCGGVLITNRHVITAAHCQPGFLANLVAVFGEYDISGEVESKRSINKNVKRVIVHRQYDAATFENDIALLELESPVQFDSHIIPICMPDDEEDFTGRMAHVTGWGRLKYSGGIPSILQEVQVPVMENRICQEMFQTAGHPKIILNSFLCAGYANGQRDSCEGDSGGPLMVEKEDGRWVLVATVSHGIKCAAPYLPGVYMRTTYYKPWLQTITGMA